MKLKPKQSKRVPSYTLWVEGETEELYLQWLAKQLRSVKHGIKVTPEVVKPSQISGYAKRATFGLEESPIYVIVDCGGEGDSERDQFFSYLEWLDSARKSKPGLDFHLGYSNLTFELWMILHKDDCHSKSCKAGYLGDVNRVFGMNLQSLSEYKKKSAFERCLDKLRLTDVEKALERAERIGKINETQGTRRERSGFSYYPSNPSLSVNEVVRKMLTDVGYIK